MSETNIHSMNDSDVFWPIDDPQPHDKVVFESVADHYVKGEDVTAYFTILNDTKVDPNDQIGLLRVGSTNIHDCLSYAPVQFSPSTTSGTTRQGKAIFPSSTLPVNDDEFYQFCYINDKRNCFGSSIPFQLNCSVDDIDLLTSSILEASLERRRVVSNDDPLIALDDQDSDDLLVVHSKRMLIEEKLRQENRELLDMNRRLEQQKDECKAKLELLELKSNEYINKVKNEMQTLASSHKTTLEELSSLQSAEAKLRREYDACRSLCNHYQTESVQYAERCRALEELNTQLESETNKIRSQLLTTTKLSEDQAIQMVDLERRLLESGELLKSANQYQSQLELQLRDLRLTTEKYQMSIQGEIDAFAKQASQQINQIHALESVNNLLKEELNTVKADNVFLLNMAAQDKQLIKELQEKIDQLNDQRRFEIEQKQFEIDELHKGLKAAELNQNDFTALKNSFNEVEKRCIQHQKNETEAKKQFSVYKEFADELKTKVQDLTERLSAGANEYKTLYRKYATLERSIGKTNQQNPTTLSNESGLNEEALVNILRNSYEIQQQDQERIVREEEKDPTQKKTSNEEIRECPMCYWEFPNHLTLDNKRDHIDNHFR